MSAASLVSKSPIDLKILGEISSTDPALVPQIVLQAQHAFGSWSRLGFKERGNYLLKVREYILNHLDELAQLISQENGKPLVEAIASDLLPTCDLIQHFAKHTEKILKSEKINIGVTGLLGRRSTLHYQPLGVIGIISPWNFPLSIPMSGIIQSLIVGNCVVLKPADATPLIGSAIEKIFHAAELPVNVLTCLAGGADVGEALLHSRLDKVIFTGSVRVGKRVMELCAKNLIPCTLELGGKDPMIVCHDAPLENAAKAAVWGAFSNAGQCCASVERVYVDERIAEAFTAKVVEVTQQLKQGPAHGIHYDVGPLTTANQLKIVEEHVADAREKGAKILTGGERNPEYAGYFYKPTVLTQIDHSFRCVKEETFGPLLPIMTFKTEEEAIHLANDSIYALTASVWTKNLKRGEKLARQIRTGTAMVNECTYSYAICQTPWGGLRHSGFGRTHGKIGLHELVHVLHVHENRMPGFRDFWWYGYNENLYRTFKTLTRELTGNGWEKLKGLVRAVIATQSKKY